MYGRQWAALFLLFLGTAALACQSGRFRQSSPPAADVAAALSPDQARAWDQTLRYFDEIALLPLRVPRYTYRLLTRFEALFGFRYEDQRLNAWVRARLHKVHVRRLGFHVAIHQRQNELLLSPRFFDLAIEERAQILVHEARHADGDGFPHVPCPSDYLYLSPMDAKAGLMEIPACDVRRDGPHGFAAAFLYEVIARQPGNPAYLIGLYNSELARILPAARR